MVAVVAGLFVLFGLANPMPARADTFGTSGNEFTIDFVHIGNAGNAADTTGYGAVSYSYRIGTYEISQAAIDKATASGMSNVTAGPWVGSQPAASITWYGAAAFVNWLNTSTGHQAAYDLTLQDYSWSMALWSSENAWTVGGTNLYRHKDAYYFLPSEDEWYKAAYYSGGGTTYFTYPTGSDTVPTAVGGGTNADTAVYGGVTNAPAAVNDAGGLSPYGTMAQGGNVWEWSESAWSGTNNLPTDDRVIRGGMWLATETPLLSSSRLAYAPVTAFGLIGLRVASIPEPSTLVLALVGAGALYAWKRRKVAR